MTKQPTPPTPSRPIDDFAATRTLVRKIRSIDVGLARAAIAAEKKKRALLEAASPVVRSMAEAKLAEPVDAVVGESGNNVTDDAGGEA